MRNGRRPSRRDHIKCDKYDGNSPWDLSLLHFETVSEHNGWSEVEQLSQLKAALRGTAMQVLQHGKAAGPTLPQLKELLQQRFGDSQQTSRYRIELKSRRRRRGETLQSLYTDVSRLAMLAHPGPMTELSQRLAVEAFVDSLNDAHLEKRVADTFPSTVEQAYNLAVRLEANRRDRKPDDSRSERVERPRRDRYVSAAAADSDEECEAKTSTPVGSMKKAGLGHR